MLHFEIDLHHKRNTTRTTIVEKMTPRLTHMLRTLTSSEDGHSYYAQFYDKIEKKRKREEEMNLQKSSLTWNFIQERINGM